jgi:DNA-binding PadR family transcriptional regulator
MSAWFGHGRLRLYLLKLLDDGPKHGYEVMRLMEDRTLGMYAPSAGTIYPRLQRLEQDGLIKHTRTDGGRKVYELTDAGRAELDRREGELLELEQELRDNIIGVADEIRGEVRDSLRDLREQLTQTTRQLRDERRGRKNLQDWWQEWSPPPGAGPAPPGSGSAPPHARRTRPPRESAAHTPPGGTAPADAVSAETASVEAAPTRSAASEWPVGDFERELQRFTEQVRRIAYRAPIDAEDVSVATAILEEALASVESALGQRKRG